MTQFATCVQLGASFNDTVARTVYTIPSRAYQAGKWYGVAILNQASSTGNLKVPVVSGTSLGTFTANNPASWHPISAGLARISLHRVLCSSSISEALSLTFAAQQTSCAALVFEMDSDSAGTLVEGTNIKNARQDAVTSIQDGTALAAFQTNGATLMVVAVGSTGAITAPSGFSTVGSSSVSTPDGNIAVFFLAGQDLQPTATFASNDASCITAEIQAAVSSGTTGTGDAALATPQLAGTGQQGDTGSGDAQLATPALNGTGQQGDTGSGTLAVPTLALSGSGSVSGAAVTGTGAVTQAAPSLAGTGQQGDTATGSAALATPSLSGTGQLGEQGTGSAALATPTLSGTGQQGDTGSGGVTAPTLALSGSGAVSGAAITGTGAITVALTLSGAGQQGTQGSGDASLPTPVVAGTGTYTSVITGTGTVTLALTLSGTGTFTAAAVTGKYRPEHDSALLDVAGATGFSVEHASALRDVADAGV